MTKTVKKIKFKNNKGKTISGILTIPKTKHKPPIVIILHSFTGYKELKPLHAISKKLAEKKLASLRFDFSDCIGESEGLCEEMMLSNQVQDTISAINFVQTLKEIDSKKIGLTGHSLGGTTAVNTASDKRIKALVTISAMAKQKWSHLFTQKQIDLWQKQGWIEFNSYKRGPIKINYSFYVDVMSYKCENNIKKINCPVRIIFGTKDKLLDLMNATFLYDNAKEPKDIKLIEGADHMFLKNPYIDEMTELTAEWFAQHLK